MAIKPITRYGKFTPTGVDLSGETRMRALAGLVSRFMILLETLLKLNVSKKPQLRGKRYVKKPH